MFHIKQHAALNYDTSLFPSTPRVEFYEVKNLFFIVGFFHDFAICNKISFFGPEKEAWST